LNQARQNINNILEAARVEVELTMANYMAKFGNDDLRATFKAQIKAATTEQEIQELGAAAY
jgi:hypothetical protein